MPIQTHKAAINSLERPLDSRLSKGSSILKNHERDEAYTTPALPNAVAFPNSTMVAFGIGTSLEGHVAPTQGGISIDTSHINKVLKTYNQDLNVVVQPGVTRSQLNTELKALGLMFTVDPGADTTIGGMAATRAC